MFISAAHRILIQIDTGTDVLGTVWLLIFDLVMPVKRDPWTFRAHLISQSKTSRLRLPLLVLYWVVLSPLFLSHMYMLSHTFDWIIFAFFVFFHVLILVVAMTVLILVWTTLLLLYWSFTLGLVLFLMLMILSFQIVMHGLLLMLLSFSLLSITLHTPDLFVQFLISCPVCALSG